MATADLDGIVADLRSAKKYRYVCEDTLRRIAAWAAVRHESRKEAVKTAKRKLHQVYGAYFDGLDLPRIEELVGGMEGDINGDRPYLSVCSEILGFHASSSERLPILGEVYGAVFEVTGVPDTILDLACGLNPFALPWMGLPETTRYTACDVDYRLVDSIGRFFGRVGRRGEAVCEDILSAPPGRSADVALLLKTLPCLEQQEKGVSLDLLRELDARFAVVSFPARSLGGRAKGMPEHYERFMAPIVEALGVACEKLAFPSEIFYVLELRERVAT